MKTKKAATPKRVWRCVQCGKESVWGKGWCYPAGLVDEVCCSATCLDKRIVLYDHHGFPGGGERTARGRY